MVPDGPVGPYINNYHEYGILKIAFHKAIEDTTGIEPVHWDAMYHSAQPAAVAAG